ncbi:retrovirus-related pol polyprotein from transposon TNT 1-94 [Tanacetum coccineum]
MHNNIIAAGSKDRLPMLATGRFARWRSRFLQYLDTKPNGDALRKCILEGPYKPTTVVAKKEAIFMLLTGIGDEIYLTVDACQTANEMWIAIERLQQATLARMVKQRLLVATAQTHQDPYYQTSKSHKSYTPTSKASLPTRSHATTRHKGKEIAKPITPLSESASDEDSDPEQAQKDKEITSSNTINKNVDTTPRYKNDNQNGNQRAVNVTGARDTVGGQVVQQSGIQCFNCKEFGYFTMECRKSKRVKDSTYHKEKMLLCKQVEKGVQLQAEESDWIVDTDEEIDEQEIVETGDSNDILDSPDMCDNDIQNDQNVVECDNERVALANLISNLKLNVDENKKIQKTLGESNSIHDSCLVALQNKQIEFERYKAFNDRTVDYDKLERTLNETLGLLAQKDIDIKEGLKVKAYEISVVKEKHDELVKQSLLTKSHYEGLVKEKTKVITDLKLKEEKDIDKMISMENQLKFLNEIVYKRSQSIQTIHMLAPKCPTFNGRPTFANPMYLKKAQYEKPCLYEIPHDQSDPANRLVPDREETLTLERESREKLNKDLVKPFDYTKELVDQYWVKHSKDHFRTPTAHDMEILIKTCLMPLALKTQNDSFAFVHELKQEIHDDLKYVESLEKEIDELESDKAEFSNMYDLLLQEYVCNDVMCSNLHSLSDLDAHTELQCLYLHKVKECVCLAQKLSKQTEFVSKVVYTELLRSFDKLEKHSISLELALQQCQEQMKNDTICKEKASNVFQKEREQYFKIQDLKAQLQDKNIAICELKKLIEICKGKYVETKFDKPSIVRQPNAQWIPKPSVLGKPAPFLDSLKRKHFSKTKSVTKTNVSEGVIHKTNDSRPQPRSTQMKDKVVPNNSQVKDKKTEVEDRPRISSVSNKTKSDPICHVFHRPLLLLHIVQLILFIVDSGCTKHMTGNLTPLCNFVEKYLGTVRFANDQFALILGYGDLVQGNITIKRVYYVEGLNHNLFSVGQLCDADLEVAFQNFKYFIRDLQGNDLLTGMSALKFVDSHNMVAFLAEPTKSEGFKQIVDFLNANPIKYALTLQALVDGKKVIITETSVRRDLQLEDAGGIECLPNVDIFEQLTLMGYEKLL